MIDDGDRIAVGVSGGKDSLTLLCALHALRRFYPKPFSIVPIFLDTALPGLDPSPIRALCAELGLELVEVPTGIYTIVFELRKEKHPCSLCAMLRRGALHDAALAQGCRKVALGHHFDDAVETLLLNLFNEGRLGCFSPVSYLDRQGDHPHPPAAVHGGKRNPCLCPARGHRDGGQGLSGRRAHRPRAHQEPAGRAGTRGQRAAQAHFRRNGTRGAGRLPCLPARPARTKTGTGRKG